MRSITISTDVFARIWSLRHPGENTEDMILRRLLDCPADMSMLAQRVDRSALQGFLDARHGVTFGEGFEVFRSYLGKTYRARATGGRWILENGRAYTSLNELSRAIGAKTENAWVNWFFLDERGQRRAVSDLRERNRVASRKRDAHVGTAAMLDDVSDDQADRTWRDDTKRALERLHGRATLSQLYKQIENTRRSAGRSVPVSLEATVRRTLEDHSSDSENYKGGPDLFCMPEGKGAGVWALRSKHGRSSSDDF